MRVTKTSEWKDWVLGLSTRDQVPKATLWPVPLIHPTTHEWAIYHPHSSIYMNVPHSEYMEYWFSHIWKKENNNDNAIP